MNKLICFAALSIALAGNTFAEDTIDFAQDIRPLLSDNCFACHGPDETTREADLRLDVRDNAIDALSPGNVDESEVVRRMGLQDPDERMPPASSHKELKPHEVELIKKWIAQGAEYQAHWSFRDLSRPKVPAIKHARNKTPIDAFVIDSIPTDQQDLAPSADRVTLARRIYFDLLGVPPTPAEVQEFVNDDSADAWKDLVNKLLDDQRFGERMAVYWLDLVRYADTIGYHSDNFMEVSAYRDYVISSFNANKSFKQFSIEQLAGDLIPEATVEQKIASGYNRLLQTTQEGGAQAKEYVAIYAADRVRNVSGVWMGLTVGCAQCHDHKYDPITAKDFYSLAAFFADIKERAVGKRTPNLKLPSAAQAAQADELRSKIALLDVGKRLEGDQELIAELHEGQLKWEAATRANLAGGKSLWQAAEPASATSTGGVILTPQPDGTLLSTGANPDVGDYTIKIKSESPVHAFKLEIFPHESFGRKGGFSRGNGNVVLTGVQAKVDDKLVKITSAVASYEQKSWPISHTLDKNPRTGWAVDGHHKASDSHAAVFVLKTPIKANQEFAVVLQHQSVHVRHLLGRFRISVSDQAGAELKAKPIPADIAAVLKVDADGRSPAQAKRLESYYRELAPEVAAAKKELADAKKALADLENSYKTMLVSESLPKPRMMRILPRGNWLDDSGEEVTPAVPEFLPTFGFAESNGDTDTRLSRLDLANWMFADGNPLTARTFANRLWSLFLGRGISRNLDDLGGQGQPPTHPELLDWLAVEYQESDWDVKHLIRQIVFSETYKQSSNTTPGSRTADANNDWFARQGRWRLDAEFVRDTALQLGGLLHCESVGGKSVKPYQPAGYWQHLNFPKRKWQSSTGQDLYRRTLYTFWCRSFLHPSLLAFDAPSREECSAQRARSNIPQQALVLLNDPVYVEASRGFAVRILESGESDDQRLAWAFKETTSRKASGAELSLLRELLNDQRKRYSQSPELAKQLVSVGEIANPKNADTIVLAVWTQVARALLNLYESTSRF